jgi:hypothetical protein
VPGPAGLAVCPHQSARVPVRRNRSDRSDTNYRTRNRPPDDPVSRGHRQAQTHRSRGMGLSFLVQPVRTAKPSARLMITSPAAHLTDPAELIATGKVAAAKGTVGLDSLRSS